MHGLCLCKRQRPCILEQGGGEVAGTSQTFQDIEEEDATEGILKEIQFELGAYFSDYVTGGRYEHRQRFDGEFQDWVRVLKNAGWVCISREADEAGDMGGYLLVIKTSKEFYCEAWDGRR